MEPQGAPAAPAVLVCVDAGGVDWAGLGEILAGLEEEGVPARVLSEPAGAGIAALARRAALASPLEVGVGIDAAGAMLHHRGTIDHRPVCAVGADTPPAGWRAVGSNAARLVKGLPLLRVNGP